MFPPLKKSIAPPKVLNYQPLISTLFGFQCYDFLLFFFYLKFKSSTISNFLQIVNMSEYNKTYRLDGEHIYKGAHLPGFSPTWLLDEIEDYEFDDDDVLIVTYCKCGMVFP